MSHDYKDFFKAAKSAKAHNKAKVKQHKAVKSHDQRKKPLVTSARKKSLLPPIIPSLLIICGLLLTGWGYMNLDEVLDFIYRIEVSPIQGLSAAEKTEAKKSSPESTEKAKVAGKTKDHESEEKFKEEKYGEEEFKHFSKLNVRKKELDHRENELNELERELQEQRKEIEARIQKLEEIRKQIGQVLREKVDVDEERVKKLVEFYSNMKPQNAAKIVASLNEDLAVEILGRMKKKDAANILNLLAPEKAQVLTEKFAGYKRR